MVGGFAVTKHEDAGGVVRLELHGEIDNDVSEAVTSIIGNAVRQDRVSALIVDLSDVPFLAAAGIRALLEGRAVALQHGMPFQVTGAHGIVRAVLHATGMDELLCSISLPPLRRPTRAADRFS